MFLGEKHEGNERRTWFVVALTAAMMVAEIVGGTCSARWRSSPTVAHVDACGGARHRGARLRSPAATPATRFAFGTGKLGELAAFASAMILALVALLIGYEWPRGSCAGPNPLRGGHRHRGGRARVNLLSAWCSMTTITMAAEAMITIIVIIT